ncbi:MAG: hypothetical protein LAN61_11240 [Acidobacteriia bacterium]|nr:hypothetical protein [Terriglobia bacterium]
MNEKPATEKAGPRFLATLQRLAVGALFALVLLVPRLLRLRRDPRSWLALRVALGVFGAALVVVPLGLWNSWVLSVTGLFLFLAAVLLPPARQDLSLDEKARELGALAVVNGGDYQPGNALPAPVHLFVGAERIWALDRALRPLLVIPSAEIRAVRVLAAEHAARLRIEWLEHAAEFSYRGFFAAHLAEVAAATIRGVLRSPLPVLRPAPDNPAAPPRGRAAGA